MAHDLMEEDSADLSDLDLEVAGEVANLPSSRRRVMSDPGALGAEKNQTDASSSLLPEGLPSFEEVTRSMQDLAEREVEAWPSPTVPQPLCPTTVLPQPLWQPTVPQPGPPAVCQPGGQAAAGILPQCRGEALVRQPGCEKTTDGRNTQLHPLPKESLSSRRSVEAGSLGKLNVERRSQSLEMVEGRRREDDDDQVDTSESLRNLQQEIESLLAPLTPLADLDQVPKVGGGSAMMLNKAEEESRTGSFELEMQVKQKEEEDLVQSCEVAKLRKEKESESGQILEKSGKEAGAEMMKDGFERTTRNTGEERNAFGDAGIKEDCEENGEEVESSDTEPEDTAAERESVFEKEKEDGIQPGKESGLEEDEEKDGSSWTVKLDKEIKDLENSAIASSRYLSHGLGLEDSLKNIENSLKSTQSRIAGYSRGEAGREVETKEKKEEEEKESPEKESVGGAPGVGARRGTTPPSIAIALKGATSMREEAKRRERHYNPRVADALDKMEAMGYTDNDGWLTQLLVMKHGNIGEVLEILTPVQK